MSQPSKLLVVEGGRESRFPIAATLRQQGWHVLSAADAVAALNLARQEQPAAIVLAAHLPGGGALTAVRRLRSLVHTAHIPIVALHEPGAARVQELLDAGARETLPQPVDAEALHEAIRRHVADPATPTEAPAAALRSAERLAAIRESGLADGPPEDSVDALMRLSQKLLGVPMAVFSVVTDDRQLFVGQAGVAEPWAARRGTPLSHSFCQWVVAGADELLVSDARQHAVLRDNSAIRDLGVVAYAGVPFSDRGDEVLGSVCAMDSRPRTWTDDDMATLRDLSILLRARAGTDEPRGSPWSRVETVGDALTAATRILLRRGREVGPAERGELSAIIAGHGRQLAELASTV